VPPPRFRGLDQARGFGLLRDLRKRCLVVHREIGQDLAVDIDRRLERPLMNVLYVIPSSRGGVDAGDPQCPELALLLPAMRY
jgi:hypothetical protein